MPVTLDISFILLSLCGILLCGIFIVVLFLLLRANKGAPTGEMKLLQNQIQFLSKSLNERMSETNHSLNQSLSDTLKNTSVWADLSNKNIETITKKLTEISETNREIKDIGSRLEGLENILKNPKRRGNLGEFFLRELLENVFHKQQFQLQFPLSTGIVDAALFIGKKIIPIDAKFPQENYEKTIRASDELAAKKYSADLKRDIKNRIDEVAKYILPEEKTTDFAFMLIPAEGIYYDVFINKIGDISPRELTEYGFSKKVIICSPSSFYAYLQTVLQGLKSLEIEEKAKEIQYLVLKLQKDLHMFEENFQKIGNSLSATVNHYNSGKKRYEIIEKDILKINPDAESSPIVLAEVESVDTEK